MAHQSKNAELEWKKGSDGGASEKREKALHHNKKIVGKLTTIRLPKKKT